MSNILQDLESTISSLKTATTKSNVGVVREVGDGVAKIEGLSDVMLNEMIEFPGGVYGIALNLEETEVERDKARITEQIAIPSFACTRAAVALISVGLITEKIRCVCAAAACC